MTEHIHTYFHKMKSEIYIYIYAYQINYNHYNKILDHWFSLVWTKCIIKKMQLLFFSWI